MRKSKRSMIEDERSACFRVDFFLPRPYLTMNDEFCRNLYLNYPSVVAPFLLPPCIWETGSLLGPAAWSLQSKERLVLFLPERWCHPLLKTCMWSSAAGWEAHMHFTSPLVIFGSVRSGVYWAIHNLTSHWGLAWAWLFLPMLLSTDSNIPKTHRVF